MKTAARVILAVVIGLVITVSTAFAADIKYSGFLGPAAVYERLKPGPEEAKGALRWINPKADFKKYNKFMVDSVIFFLADEADYKGIDPQEMKELADEFNKAIVAAFRDKYPIVAEPGPDVARLRFAITNVKPSRPGVSAVTSVVPIGLGVSLIKKGATGGWTGSGETGAELIVLDTETNDVLALGADNRAAGFDERFSKWGSATDAFKFWSERVVTVLDSLKGIKRAPKK